MTLSTLISAAEFLYLHSPAQYVTAEKNTLVVYGKNGNELADAVFSLLFMTAFRPGTAIRLLRVMPAEAEEAELEFVSRNEEGISVFAQNAYSKSSGKQPLRIRFLNDADYVPEEYGIAWAASLDGGGWNGDCCYTEKDIPDCKPAAGQWSAADEKYCKVLQTARRVHMAYTSTWNSRYTEKRINEDLYGKDDQTAYNLRSSLRFAVSVPWKLAAAGIRNDGNIPEKLYQKLNEPDGKTRDLLVWQEHRSWQAFMTLEGWRAPTPEELTGYFFRDGNDHRNKKQKWHPCLCDLQEDDWNDPHEHRLKDTPIHRWSIIQKNPDGYCRMDRMSLQIHHLCKEWVLSKEYTDRMNAVFRELETALVSSGLEKKYELSELAGRMENLFLRLRGNETNSYAPWNQACDDFLEMLGNKEDARKIKRIYQKLRTEARAAVERNSYRDYKEIDAQIIRWLPWILFREKIQTVWKLYSKNNLLENLLSAMILRPRELRILCEEKEIPDIPVNAFRKLLKNHGTGETEIRVVSLAALENETVPAGPEDVTDVTGCGEMICRLSIPSGARIVYYGNHDLQDKKGAPFFAPIYHPYDFTLTIHEVLRLRGLELLSDTLNNEMLGMEADYTNLWQARRETPGKAENPLAWHHTIVALRKAEEPNRRYVYRKCDSRSCPYEHSFQPETYEILGKTGAIHVLQELESAGCIANLEIDPVEGRVACDIFPASGEKECYEETAKNLTAMLEDLREDSRYAFDNGFVDDGKPCFIVNLAEPLQMDEIAIAVRIKREEKPKLADTGRELSAGEIKNNLHTGIQKLAGKGLLLQDDKKETCRYKSVCVRRGLEQEGSALEAFVYYTLFLSGEFDDVRCNVRYRNGISAAGRDKEKEIDILVTRKGRVGLISCKDTVRFDLSHIGEIRMQADLYAINAKPILICSKDPDPEQKKMFRYLNVGLITKVSGSLATNVIRLMEQ